jgi:hypothetical protein
MALHTRVIVQVLHKKYGFAQSTTDSGAKFRDEADIARVMNQLVTDAKRRFGQDARISVTTREAA